MIKFTADGVIKQFPVVRFEGIPNYEEEAEFLSWLFDAEVVTIHSITEISEDEFNEVF